MSAAKRSRSGQAAPGRSASPPPASKRQKVLVNGHATSKTNGLGFLVDENARDGRHLKAELTNGAPASRAVRVHEPRAVVAPDTSDEEADSDDEVDGHEDESSGEAYDRAGGAANIKSGKAIERDAADVIDISSAESSDLESEGDVEGSDHPKSQSTEKMQSTKASMNGANDRSGSAEVDDTEEPAFGELLARHEGPIDVAESSGNTNNRTLALKSQELDVSGLSSATLGTVLTQALKTNDKDQLETCFQVTDVDRIRATIQRLHSQHVATLLQRISERIYSRPGRTGSLFVWIQWSLVVHGGFLATHPDVIRKLKSLSRILKERARGLQPLLHLKGKIDMLSAQLDLRRSVRQSAAIANASDQDNEDGVIYVEGQQQEWSDDDGEMAAHTIPKAITAASKVADPDSESDLDSDAGDGALANGLVNDVDVDDSEDDEEDDDEDSEGLLDLEAEVASDDDDDDDDEEDSEDREQEESESDAESAIDDDDSQDDNIDLEAVKQPKPRAYRG